jgi:hypothetical protein
MADPRREWVRQQLSAPGFLRGRVAVWGPGLVSRFSGGRGFKKTTFVGNVFDSDKLGNRWNLRGGRFSEIGGIPGRLPERWHGQLRLWIRLQERWLGLRNFYGLRGWRTQASMSRKAWIDSATVGSSTMRSKGGVAVPIRLRRRRYLTNPVRAWSAAPSIDREGHSYPLIASWPELPWIACALQSMLASFPRR